MPAPSCDLPLDDGRPIHYRPRCLIPQRVFEKSETPTADGGGLEGSTSQRVRPPSVDRDALTLGLAAVAGMTKRLDGSRFNEPWVVRTRDRLDVVDVGTCCNEPKPGALTVLRA